MTTLYVGNLPFSASEDEIRGLFGEHGAVDSVKIITDRETGRPRGFAFVDMPADAAQKASAALNGFEMNGRALRVNEARERPPRSPRGRSLGERRGSLVAPAGPAGLHPRERHFSLMDMRLC